MKIARDYIKSANTLIEKSMRLFIGSIDDEGYPNMKVMLSPREHKGIKDFYFTTNTHSMRVKQFQNNPKACIYFFDGRFFRAVMLKGKMEVLQNQAAKDRIWREGDDRYYKLGVTDPDYCVLHFTAESGRFYENFGSADFKVK
jgi:general stress protein 26